MAEKFVKCTYTFDGETETDLSLNIGDLIKVTQVVNADWYEGTLNGKTGQFPKAFVEPASEVFDVGIVLSNFPGEQDGDLPLKEGEFVVITQIVDENWSRGYTHGGLSGVFPRNFVKQVSFEDSAIKQAMSAAVPGFGGNTTKMETPRGENVYEVISPFSSQNEYELSLVKGMLVTVSNKLDNFWLEGKLDNGMTGMFPRTCIDYLDDFDGNDASESNDQVSAVVEQTLVGTQSEDIPPVTKPSKNQHAKAQYYEAIYDYNSAVDGDLRFSVGDRIQLLEIIDENWYKGSVDNTVGIFPSNHVKKLELDVSTENNSSEQRLDESAARVKKKDSQKTQENITTNNSRSEQNTSRKNVTEKSKQDGQPRKGPPKRPATGPKKKHSAETKNLTVPTEMKSASSTESLQSDSQSSSPRMPKKKPPPPGRPKLPASKKDIIPPFSYKFKTKSQPTVIIPGRFVKPGEPHIIFIRKSAEVAS